MAKLDANSEFEKGRALSVPVVKVPRSVKEWLCIDRAYENGNFKIEPMTGEAMYDQSYVFEDINYVNKDTSKKDSTTTVEKPKDAEVRGWGEGSKIFLVYKCKADSAETLEAGKELVYKNTAHRATQIRQSILLRTIWAQTRPWEEFF